MKKALTALTALATYGLTTLAAPAAELPLDRIKLPEGWEYVIEDGEIAFREPKEREFYLTNNYCGNQSKFIPMYQGHNFDGRKYPIIKKVEEKGNE